MKVDEDDPKIYQKHLYKLLGLEFVLRVNHQPYYHQSFVLGVSRDPVVIKKIKSHLQPEEQQLDEVLCVCRVLFLIIDLTVSFSVTYIWFSFYYCRMLSMIIQPRHSFLRRIMLLLSAQIPLTLLRYNN